MTLLDSSCWLQFFMDGPKAGQFASYLKDLTQILTPTIVVYEVSKIARRERGEQAARLCLGQMNRTLLAPLDADLAALASQLSLRYSLAMADAIVLATARTFGAQLITTDPDFRRVPGVRVV